MIVPLTYPTFLLVFPKDPLLLFFFFFTIPLIAPWQCQRTKSRTKHRMRRQDNKCLNWNIGVGLSASKYCPT